MAKHAVDPIFPDEELLYRAVNPIHANEDGSIDVAAMYGEPYSVNRSGIPLGRYSLPHHALRFKYWKDWHVAKTDCKKVRATKKKTEAGGAMTFDVRHDPSSKCQPHSVIDAYLNNVLTSEWSDEDMRRMRTQSAKLFQIHKSDD